MPLTPGAMHSWRPPRPRHDPGRQHPGSAIATGFSRILGPRLPNLTPRVIFDVGANVGQSATEFADAYPDAAVYAFEPVSAAYRRNWLRRHDRPRPGVELPPCDGSRAGRATMRSTGTFRGNRIVPGHRGGPEHEDVDVITGDAFCESHGIEHIDLLKVSAVGHDLDVLVGFSRMLGVGAIDVVQVEASSYVENVRMVALQRLVGYLEPFDYHLFGIYQQARDFRGEPTLARITPVFISRPTIEANTVVAGR